MARIQHYNTSRIKELGKTQRRQALRPPRRWRDQLWWIGCAGLCLAVIVALFIAQPHAGKHVRKATTPVASAPSLPAKENRTPQSFPVPPDATTDALQTPPDATTDALASSPKPPAPAPKLRREETRNLPFGLNLLTALPAMDAAWFCIEPLSLPADATELGAYSQMQALMGEGSASYRTGDFAGAAALWQRGWKIAWARNYKGCMLAFGHNLGDACLRAGQFAAAAEMYDEVSQLRRIGQDTPDSHRLSALRALAYTGVGNHDAALPLYEAALKSFTSLAESNREAMALQGIAVALAYRYATPKAIELVERAIQLWRTANLPAELADSLTRLAIFRQLTGDYPQALCCHEEALALHRKLQYRKREMEDIVLLAGVYARQGDRDKSALFYHQAIDICKSLAHRQGEAEALLQLSNLHYLQGELVVAAQLLEQAQALCKELGNPRCSADVTGNLGVIYRELGDYRRANDCFRQIMKIYRESQEHGGMSHAFFQLAATYDEVGDYANALLHYKISLLGYLKARDVRGLGNCFLKLALSCHNAGETVEGMVFVESARQVFEKIGIADDQLDVITAELHLANGEWDKALAIYAARQDALELGHCRLSQKQFAKAREHFTSGLTALPNRQIVARIGIGLAYEGEQRFADAAASFRQAYQLLEEKRAGLRDNERMHFLAGKEMFFSRLTPYEGLVRVLPHTVEKNRGALYYAETTHSRLFLEAMTRRYAAAKYPQPVYVEEIPLQPDEFLLQYEVTEPYTKLFVVHDKKVVATRNIAITRYELNKLVARYLAFFHDVKYVKDLERYDVQDATHLYELLLKPVLEQKDAHGNLRMPPASKIIIVPDETLGLLPFESLVMNSPSKVEMVPGKYGATPLAVRYVGDLYDIAYAPSATALALQRTFRREKRPSKALFVLADPIFSLGDERSRMLRSQTQEAEYADAINRVRDLVTPLTPQSRQADSTADATRPRGQVEEEEIRRVFKTRQLANNLASKVFAGEKVDTLLDERASEQQVKQQNLSQYRYLVFATHGMAEDDLPDMFEPALVLSQLDKDDDNDGLLSLSEVSSMHLQADVVVLTACRSGLGRNVRGEGVMGLGRAFQHAGAHAVLATMWSVSEEAATLFTEHFFTYLNHGKSKRDSLRLARRQVRCAGFDHPVYWAPFIMIGD